MTRRIPIDARDARRRDRRRAAGALLAALLGLAAAPAGRGQDAGTNGLAGLVTAEGTLVLSLEHCLELALGGNIDLEIGRLAPLRRGEDFFIAGETFTPTMRLEARREERESRTANTQVGAPILLEDEDVFAADIRKTWALGTRTDLIWAYSRREDNSEFRTLNPAHETRLGIEVTQPLLKGFGVDVNRAELRRAILDKTIADREFEMLLEGELLDTYRAYWGLARAAADLALQETSLALADEQVATIRDRLDVGAASPLELTSAQAAQARQREAVILARLAYRKAGDRLLYQIHPRGQARDADLRLIPSTEPDLSGGMPPVPDARAAIRKALAQRPELGLEDARIERAEVGVLESANRRRPELNVFGRYQYGGLNDSFGNSMDDVVNTEFPEWQAGVSLEFLFDGRARLARWRQAAIERTSAELGRQRAEARVALETRAALFDLEAAIQAVEAAALTLKLAREQYEGERDRLAVGASTVFRVDAYRRDLLDAERQHLNARIAVFLAQAVLEAAQGQFARAIVASAAHVEGD